MINATFQVFFQVKYLWTCEKKRSLYQLESKDDLCVINRVDHPY